MAIRLFVRYKGLRDREKEAAWGKLIGRHIEFHSYYRPDHISFASYRFGQKAWALEAEQKLLGVRDDPAMSFINIVLSED